MIFSLKTKHSARYNTYFDLFLQQLNYKLDQLRMTKRPGKDQESNRLNFGKFFVINQNSVVQKIKRYIFYSCTWKN